MSALSIIVVAYGASDYLRRCLDSLADTQHEVIVVDNGTTQLSSPTPRDPRPGVRFLDQPENLGYGRAANLGMQAANGRFVLLLNADAWPVADAVERLLSHAEQHPRGAVFGPRLITPDGVRQRSVFAAPAGPLALAAWAASPHAVSAAYSALQRLRSSRAGRPEAAASHDCVEIVREQEYVQGSVLMLRREALADIGGFDERFFMFSEDADICRRVRRSGWSVQYVPSVTFVHVGAASTSLEPERMYRVLLVSHLRLLAKHHGLVVAERARRLMIVGLTIRSAAPTRRERSQAAARWLRGTPVSRLLEAND